MLNRKDLLGWKQTEKNLFMERHGDREIKKREGDG